MILTFVEVYLPWWEGSVWDGSVPCTGCPSSSSTRSKRPPFPPLTHRTSSDSSALAQSSIVACFLGSKQPLGRQYPRQLGPWQNSRIRVTCRGCGGEGGRDQSVQQLLGRQ